ncbi:MAG: ATP-binding protein [Gemmatimonadota bacterium]|nr:ATP-binding protein [Gemmatimonadota bacterium]
MDQYGGGSRQSQSHVPHTDNPLASPARGEETPTPPPAAARADVSARPNLADILETITDAFFALDHEWRFTYVNRHAEEVWQRQRSDLLGRHILEVFPHLRDSEAHRAMERAARERVTVHYEGRSPVRDLWIDALMYPSPTGVSVYFRDVADRKRAEVERRFLAEVGNATTSALDVGSVVRAVALHCVESFADCCVIDLIDQDGAAQRVAVAHHDGSAADGLVRQLLDLVPNASSTEGVGRVLRGGATVLYSVVTPDFLDAECDTPARKKAMTQLAPRSVIMSPLVARGRVVGVLSLVSCAEWRRYEQADVDVAEEAARRVALAVDNARLYEMAQEANQAKADFLATMSHELRTPLTAILGYADLLVDDVFGALTLVQKEQIDRIKSGGEHLLLLVEELLSFARLETGHETLSVESAELAEVIDETVALIQPLTRRKRLEFIVELPDHPVPMRTDRRKVRQVLLNLLANSVKFTESGSVSMRAHLDGEWVVFDVADSGIGIPIEHIEHIFDPFWQVEQNLTRRVGGTGLGLTVVRHLVHLLGGDVTVDSVPGTGTRCTVRLPLISASSAPKLRA